MILLQKNCLSLSDNKLLTYCILRYYEVDGQRIYITPDKIYEIFGRDNNNKRLRNRIYDGLGDLYLESYVDDIVKVSKGKFDVKGTDFKSDEPYIIMYKNEFRNIMATDYMTSRKISLLRTFLSIIASFDYSNSTELRLRYKVCAFPLSYFEKTYNILDSIFLRNTDDLIDMGLLYAKRDNGVLVTSKGNLCRYHTCYSRPKDSEVCDEYFSLLKKRVSPASHKPVRTGSDGRSLTQKYNRLIKGASYPDDEVAKVFDYIIKYNNLRIKEILDLFGKEDYWKDNNKISGMIKSMKDETFIYNSKIKHNIKPSNGRKYYDGTLVYFEGLGIPNKKLKCISESFSYFKEEEGRKEHAENAYVLADDEGADEEWYANNSKHKKRPTARSVVFGTYDEEAFYVEDDGRRMMDDREILEQTIGSTGKIYSVLLEDGSEIRFEENK